MRLQHTLLALCAAAALACSPAAKTASNRGAALGDSSSAVTFVVDNAQTVWGQNVYVVGDAPELGSWDPAAAVALAPTSYPTWTGTVTLTQGAHVAFKFIIKDASGSVTWESGDNRQLDVPLSTSVQYEGPWDDTTQGSVTGGSGDVTVDGGTGAGHAIKTVFIILMENHNWSDIKGSASAPYINNTLLPMAAHAEQYYNPPGNHPSEPNYLWLEAGTNFGVTNDSDPSSNEQSSTQHLVTLLQNAGIRWKSYQEDIDGTTCPLTSVNDYAPKHNPMVFFDDVTNNLDANSANCIAHVRPYTELATDLKNNTVPQYVFITPNLCDDMHGVFFGCSSDPSQGDAWLSREVPRIMASKAYQDGGAIFVTWDESEGGDNPIGMLVISPYAKKGYANTVAYTHSSTLRTFQEIFGVTPFLGDAANATDLSDLFTQFP